MLFRVLFKIVLLAYGSSSISTRSTIATAHYNALLNVVPGHALKLHRPPTKVNLATLLVRNVPPMPEYLRSMMNNINTDQINKLIESTDDVNNDSLVSEKHAGDDYVLRNHKVNCPQVPPNLVGSLMNHTDAHGNLTMEKVLDSVPDTLIGGEWQPQNCISNHKVAVIIPYRDRKEHLAILLAHLHPILQKQQLHYKIYVIEQSGTQTFNKARIMNIGFIHALFDNPEWQCFIFHDVDLVPEDDRNMHSCPEYPRHLSVAIKQFDYKLPYDFLVGGVFAIRTNHFFQVNGYSNIYWGWGAEDDDMAFRLRHVGLKIIRPPANVARYHMIDHRKRPAMDERVRYKLLWNGVRRYKIDGLNSLPVMKYTIKSIQKEPLYTRILIDIGPPPAGFR